ncbi:MAG: cyclic nucleotide-binding domain-containing protein [Burkholderiales bacterium]|nr:cyclic nucleotide-binding domain-containing protein [Burkholderiales bacterium]
MTDLDKIEALKNSKLGAELSAEQARVLSESVRHRELADGEVLVAEGERNNHLYVIVSGNLRVVRNAGAADEVTLFVLTAGDLVGELSFIDDTEHYASLVSRGNTHIFGIEREQLEGLLKTDADIVYRVMRAIIRTVHQIQRRLSMQQVELTNYIYKQHGKY